MAVAPAVCWSAGRVDVDFSLSRKLIAKLDAEKGIRDNGLLSTSGEVAADVKEEKVKDVKEGTLENANEEKAEDERTADVKEANGSAELKEDVTAEDSALDDGKKTETEGKHHKSLLFASMVGKHSEQTLIRPRAVDKSPNSCHIL